MALTAAELVAFFRGDVSDLERAAAKAKAINRAAADDTTRSWAKAGRGASQGFDREFNIEKSTKRAEKQIDSVSGRLGLLVQSAAALGPGLLSGAVPAMAGLAVQGGAVAIGFAAVAGSFQGVKKTMDAVAKADLQPTVANLNAARVLLAKLPPEGKAMVRELHQLGVEGERLRNIGQAQMFPGMISGLETARRARAPQIRELMALTSREVGSLSQRAGRSLASARFDPMFTEMLRSTPRLLDDTATSAGNAAEAVANLWVAAMPLGRDFSSGIRGASADLAAWSRGVRNTQGYREFLAYAETSERQIVEAGSQVAKTFLEIGEAAAPLTGPVLKSLEEIARVVGVIADSPLGTPLIGGYLALSMISKTADKLQGNAALSMLFGRGPAGGAGAAAGGRAGMLSGVVGTYSSQVRSLRDLPGAYRAASRAQEQLAVAQADAKRITREYVGQLQAVNSATARGIPQSSRAQAALADSLSKVEMAQYGVRTATERAAAAEAEQARLRRSATVGAIKTAAGAAAIGVAASGMADKFGLANTAALALAGSMAGPVGTAVGAGIGALMDARAQTDNLRKATDQLNVAIRGGDWAGMARGVDETKRQMKEAHKFRLTDLVLKNPTGAVGAFGLFQQQRADKSAQKAMDEANRKFSTERARTQLSLLRDGLVLTGTGAETLGGKMKNLQDLLSGGNEFLQGRAAARDFQAAIDAATAALKENGHTVKNHHTELDIDTEKGRANAAALDNIASTALAVASTMELGSKRQVQAIESGREAFIRQARAIGLTAAAAEKLADQAGLKKLTLDLNANPAKMKAEDAVKYMNQLKALVKMHGYDIPARGKAETLIHYINRLKALVKIDANDAAARASVRNLKAYIAAYFAKPITQDILIRNVMANPVTGGVPLAPSKGGSHKTSSGGKRPGQQHARGGFLTGPGTGTSDDIPIWASNGEYMVNARSTAKHRAVLDWINADRYATGGPVGITGTPAPITAGDVAAARALTVALNGLTQVTRTDVLRQRQQIHSLQAQLAERDAKGRYTLRGIDRQVATAELADAKRELLQLTGKVFSDDLMAKARELGDLLAGGQATTGVTTAAGLVRQMARQQSMNTQFTQALAALAKGGLNRELLQQLAGQGPTAASVALSKSILASGNIKTLNALQGNLDKQAAAYGAWAAGGKAGPTATGPLVNIEQFNTSDMSVDEVAEQLWFKSQVRN